MTKLSVSKGDGACARAAAFIMVTALFGAGCGNTTTPSQDTGRNLPAGSKATEAWRVERGHFLPAPVVYEFDTDGSLAAVHLTIPDTGLDLDGSGQSGSPLFPVPAPAEPVEAQPVPPPEFDDTPVNLEPEEVPFTDVILPGTMTDVVLLRIEESPSLTAEETLSVLYNDLSLRVDGEGTAILDFDVSSADNLDALGVSYVRTWDYTGSLTGTLSEDGTTITWTGVTGSLTIHDNYNLDDTRVLEPATQDGTSFGPERVPLGSWTRTDVPERSPDTDGDGVRNPFDRCPRTPESTEIDRLGCADTQRDTDEDDVVDAADLCPNTPAGEPADDDGCGASQSDADDDGISDLEDVCANTPAGTGVDAHGCAVPSPGPISQSWQADGDLFVGELFDPVIYDLTTDGALNRARLTVSPAALAGEEDVEVEIVSDVAPFGVVTDLIIVSGEVSQLGPVSFDFGIRFDKFDIDVDFGGAVVWEFDLTITGSGSFLFFPADTETRYEGTMTGTVSPDGTIITWESVRGTVTRSETVLEESSQMPLTSEFAGRPLGSWSLVE